MAQASFLANGFHFRYPRSRADRAPAVACASEMVFGSMPGWLIFVLLHSIQAASTQEPPEPSSTETTQTQPGYNSPHFPRTSRYDNRGSTHYQNTYVSGGDSSSSSDSYMGPLKVIWGVLVIIFIMICLCASVSKALPQPQAKQGTTVADTSSTPVSKISSFYAKRRSNSGISTITKSMASSKDRKVEPQTTTHRDESHVLNHFRHGAELESGIGSSLQPGLIVPVCPQCGLKLRFLSRRLNEPQIKSIPVCPVCGTTMHFQSEGVSTDGPKETWYPRSPREEVVPELGATDTTNAHKSRVPRHTKDGEHTRTSFTSEDLPSDSISSQHPTSRSSDDRTAEGSVVRPPTYDEVMSIPDEEEKIKITETSVTIEATETYPIVDNPIEVKILPTSKQRHPSQGHADWPV